MICISLGSTSYISTKKWKIRYLCYFHRWQVERVPAKCIREFHYLTQFKIIIIILIIIFTSLRIMSRDLIIIIYHLQLHRRHARVMYGMSKFTALTYCIIFKFLLTMFSEPVTSEIKLVTIISVHHVCIVMLIFTSAAVTIKVSVMHWPTTKYSSCQRWKTLMIKSWRLRFRLKGSG